jgi:hypothetical protein
MNYTIPVISPNGKLQRHIMAKRSKIKPKPESIFKPNFVMIDNPLFQTAHDESRTNPRQTKAMHNPKESPAAWLLHHGNINASQYRAASEVRRLHELTGAGGVRAFDYEKTKVDGGGAGNVFTDHRMDAAKRLSEVKDVLGQEGYELTIKVCGDGLWINQVEQSRYRQIVAGQNLKQCLTSLAIFFGYESGKIKAWRA